jgi:hypothetical protein
MGVACARAHPDHDEAAGDWPLATWAWGGPPARMAGGPAAGARRAMPGPSGFKLPRDSRRVAARGQLTEEPCGKPSLGLCLGEVASVPRPRPSPVGSKAEAQDPFFRDPAHVPACLNWKRA